MSYESKDMQPFFTFFNINIVSNRPTEILLYVRNVDHVNTSLKIALCKWMAQGIKSGAKSTFI